MKIVRFLLALLIFSISAAPLTHHDKEILEQLNIADTEALTQQSFNQLFYDATKDNKKIVLAAVKDKGSDHIFFFDLVQLFSAIETSKKFINPLNRQEIQSLRIYRAPAERYFLTQKGLTHKTVGSFSISKPNPLTINDFEFIGELRSKPQEGFYKYMKNHGIDPTNFTGPFKQYSPTNLPRNILQLQDIADSHYPVDQETIHQAQLNIVGLLLPELAKNEKNQQIENLLQNLLTSNSVTTKQRDRAAFLKILYLYNEVPQFLNIFSDDGTLNQSNIVKRRIIFSQLLPLVMGLLRSSTTLTDNDLKATFILALDAYLFTAAPIQKIKDILKSLTEDARFTQETKIALKNNIISKIDLIINESTIILAKKLSHDQQEIAYRSEFIKAFSNGKIEQLMDHLIS